MTPERWQNVERLYQAARARPVDERAGFLDAACAGDVDLQREVESLLAEPASENGLLDQPGLAVAAQMISNPIGTMVTGRRIGAYQIQTLLGTGGMGEVYRARDTKLGRDVAIKILARGFTSDPERLARFEQLVARVEMWLRVLTEEHPDYDPEEPRDFRHAADDDAIVRARWEVGRNCNA